MSYCNVTIYCQPHVVKFIQNYKGFKESPVIIDNRENFMVSSLMRFFIMKKRNFHNSYKRPKCINQSYMPTEIRLNKELWKNDLLFVHPSDFVRLNNIIHGFFMAKLESYYVAAKTYQSEKKSNIEIILDFCSLYEIDDEDVNVDSLLRQLYRSGVN